MKRARTTFALVLLLAASTAIWFAEPASALAARATTESEQAAMTASHSSLATAQDRPQAQTSLVAERRSGKKPWYKSRTAKIVGGGAGAGALVGGLVGGGKGAAAGALVGSGAGYLYDRTTKKKKLK